MINYRGIGMEGLSGKKKVLVVDDNETSLVIAEKILSLEYEMFTAKSGREALNFLVTGHVPDIILLDVVMPNMDGWDTFNKIRGISLLHNVPIALVTSLTGETDIRHARDIGAADFITKPYSKNEFLERVKNILERKMPI